MGLFSRRAKTADAEALQPIAGISLERFAELAVKMKDTGDDPAAWIRIAEECGVDRATWEAARQGWTDRMNDPATAGTVAVAYHPIYQQALERWGGPPATATFDEYIEMSAMVRHDPEAPSARPTDPELMYRHFGITASDWSQISTHWTGQLSTSAQLSEQFVERMMRRIAELDAEHAHALSTEEDPK